MHTSKLSTLVIDCKTDDLSSATGFWAAALRREVAAAKPGDDRYRDLVVAPSEPLIMIQRVEHESRVHLDIETDDIEAEVERLQALGARSIQRVHTWVVMEAPTGQRFCVVRQQRPAHVPAPFETTPAHELLASFSGHYHGKTRTFFTPDAEPVQSEDTLYIEPILNGRWLRIQWFGSVGSQARQGEMLLGFHKDAREYELSWIDTFHTGTATMWSRGKVRDDDIISVTGSYAAGDETWGWQTVLARTAAGLSLRAFNITPSGEKHRAIETDWIAGKPGALDDLSAESTSPAPESEPS